MLGAEGMEAQAGRGALAASHQLPAARFERLTPGCAADAVVQVDGAWVHAGIVSAGVPCREYFGWYGKYTRTSAHLAFTRQPVPNVAVTGKIPAGATLPAVNLLLLTP